jgi:hypothetical protein
MGRIYTRVHRLLRLITTVQSRRGLKVPDLAMLCEAHERTIYGDIGTINEAGIPCGFDSESQGYRVGPGFFMPPIELTLEESMAIVALLEELGDGTQIPFLGAASRAAEKIRSQLPRAVLDSIDPVDGHVHIDANVVGTPIVSNGLDELYNYDNVNRLTLMQRGTLNSGKTAITGMPSREMDYTLDPTGNWSTYLTKTTGTTDLNQARCSSTRSSIDQS